MPETRRLFIPACDKVRRFYRTLAKRSLKPGANEQLPTEGRDCGGAERAILDVLLSRKLLQAQHCGADGPNNALHCERVLPGVD